MSQGKTLRPGQGGNEGQPGHEAVCLQFEEHKNHMPKFESQAGREQKNKRQEEMTRK